MVLKRKPIYHLNSEEADIINLGVDDPDIITDYFFRPFGRTSGWKLDENFTEEGAWQKKVHFAAQNRIIVIGGFGSGKTRGVAVSACVHSMVTPDFKFMNTAPKSWQADLMYNFILDVSRSTPFEKLIYEYPKRPYPVIKLMFYIGDYLMVSTLEFMSLDRNANTILSWEGDWCNIDEAGQVDDLQTVIRNLGSRMRGSINGRDRLGRLSMVSNSWDNPEMWYRFDLAKEMPDDFLSLVISSRDNKNITEKQLKAMLKDIPEEEIGQFIDGTRPEGRGNYFAKEWIYEAEDDIYGKMIQTFVEKETPGYVMQTQYGCGVVNLVVPKSSQGNYVIVGDPGTDGAPNRNSPVIGVWDVSSFPQSKASLVGFWWGSGNGSITPFVNKLLWFMELYNPIWTGIDSTASQKNMAELLNIYIQSDRIEDEQIAKWFGGVNLSKVYNKTIHGMDFSGSKKSSYLVAGRLFLEARLVTWPKFIIGMRSQLTNYDPEKDQKSGHLSQDIVAMYCMGCAAIRFYFGINPNDYIGTVNSKIQQQDIGTGDRSERPYRAEAFSNQR